MEGDKIMLEIGTRVKHYKGIYFIITDKVDKDFYRAQGIHDAELMTNVGINSVEAGHFTVVSDKEWEEVKKRRSANHKLDSMFNVRSFPTAKGKKLIEDNLEGEELDYEEVFENVF